MCVGRFAAQSSHVLMHGQSGHHVTNAADRHRWCVFCTQCRQPCSRQHLAKLQHYHDRGRCCWTWLRDQWYPSCFGLWAFWLQGKHLASNKYICRMTNYELLRWLVEMQSRDVDHYHMISASQSTVCHYNDKWSRDRLTLQEAQLSLRDHAMRLVSWNLANWYATVQKLLVRQVLNQVSAVASWPVR